MWFYKQIHGGIRLLKTYARTGHRQASEVEVLAKLFIDLKLLTIFAKRFPS